MSIFLKIILCFGLFYSSFSNAYEPFLSDDTSTTEHGKNQVDLYVFNILEKPGPTNYLALTGPSISIPGEEFYSPDRSIAYPFTYTRGVSEHTEASIGFSYYGLPTGNYSPLANLLFGLKHRFYGETDQGWSFAIRPSISMPVSPAQQEGGLGLARLGAEAALIASYFTDSYDFHINASTRYTPYNKNYSVGGTTDEFRETGYFLSAAIIYNLSNQWKLGYDTGLQSNPVVGDQRYNYFVLGALMYTPVESVTIGLSYLRVSATFGESFINGPYSSIAKLGVSYRF